MRPPTLATARRPEGESQRGRRRAGSPRPVQSARDARGSPGGGPGTYCLHTRSSPQTRTAHPGGPPPRPRRTPSVRSSRPSPSQPPPGGTQETPMSLRTPSTRPSHSAPHSRGGGAPDRLQASAAPPREGGGALHRLDRGGARPYPRSRLPPTRRGSRWAASWPCRAARLTRRPPRRCRGPGRRGAACGGSGWPSARRRPRSGCTGSRPGRPWGGRPSWSC